MAHFKCRAVIGCGVVQPTPNPVSLLNHSLLPVLGAWTWSAFAGQGSPSRGVSSSPIHARYLSQRQHDSAIWPRQPRVWTRYQSGLLMSSFPTDLVHARDAKEHQARPTEVARLSEWLSAIILQVRILIAEAQIRPFVIVIIQPRKSSGSDDGMVAAYSRSWPNFGHN